MLARPVPLGAGSRRRVTPVGPCQHAKLRHAGRHVGRGSSTDRGGPGRSLLLTEREGATRLVRGGFGLEWFVERGPAGGHDGQVGDERAIRVDGRQAGSFAERGLQLLSGDDDWIGGGGSGMRRRSVKPADAAPSRPEAPAAWPGRANYSSYHGCASTAGTSNAAP